MPQLQNQHTDAEAAPSPSKTQLKKQMHKLQALGEALTELSVSQLAHIDLPVEITEALHNYKQMTAHGAKRRQRQYIGKLMRNVDSDPIEAYLAELQGLSAEANALHRRIELLRERFLENEQVLQEISQNYPNADFTRLKQLRRNALKETKQRIAGNNTQKNFRALFQALKTLEDA